LAQQGDSELSCSEIAAAVMVPDRSPPPPIFPTLQGQASASLKDPNPVNANAPKRVAIVIANPAVSTTTGWPVGF
jgi:hypothetical protein